MLVKFVGKKISSRNKWYPFSAKIEAILNFTTSKIIVFSKTTRVGEKGYSYDPSISYSYIPSIDDHQKKTLRKYAR